MLPFGLIGIQPRDLTIQEFHQVADETLHRVCDLLEQLVESDHPRVSGWDIEYSSGVMNFSMGEHGTYVLNKQPPNKQIWLSSPFSGPKRFDYDQNQGCWFYSRDRSQLVELMRDEISSILTEDTFSKLLASWNHQPLSQSSIGDPANPCSHNGLSAKPPCPPAKK